MDLGVRKGALVVLDGDDLIFAGAVEAADAPRSAQLHRVASWIRNHCIEFGVEVAYVEEPLVGRSTRVSLQIAQTAGAVLSHLAGVSPSYLVSNTAWKKDVIGVGAGKDIKLKVRMWLDEHYPHYAERCDRDQDRYDACCIALYGQQQQLIASRLREGAHLSRA